MDDNTIMDTLNAVIDNYGDRAVISLEDVRADLKTVVDSVEQPPEEAGINEFLSWSRNQTELYLKIWGFYHDARGNLDPKGAMTYLRTIAGRYI